MKSSTQEMKLNILQKIFKFIRLARSNDVQDQIWLQRRLNQVPVWGQSMRLFYRIRAQLTQRSPKAYVRMQKRNYELYAAADHISEGHIDGDFVVGSWSKHDEWPDYGEYLMRYVPRDCSWLGIDYGCGPGRNLRRWSSLFKRIDGVDISAKNLENARVFLGGLPKDKTPNLFVTEGMDCGAAPKSTYDFAFSTICMQHICVHRVRFLILSSLFACLKPGGRISVQMGYGVPSPSTVPYFEDYVAAVGTNRESDVAISSPDEPRADFEKIGFINFEFWIRPVGPGDIHPNWIFFTAIKPN
jgi:SAM-dependent methyltransferase